MQSFVALLCTVNVGGTGKAPSAALKSAAESMGARVVQHVLRTGNPVFRAEALEARLERAFRDALGLTEIAGETLADTRIGAKVIGHARSTVFQMAEAAVPRDTCSAESST